MADLLDLRIEQASSRAVAGEATEADWMILITARQCDRLGAIGDEIGSISETLGEVHRTVSIFAMDRKRVLGLLAGLPLVGVLGGAGSVAAATRLLELLGG